MRPQIWGQGLNPQALTLIQLNSTTVSVLPGWELIGTDE